MKAVREILPSGDPLYGSLAYTFWTDGAYGTPGDSTDWLADGFLVTQGDGGGVPDEVLARSRHLPVEAAQLLYGAADCLDGGELVSTVFARGPGA